MTRRYAAFLFDMDGTLINSIPSAIRAWTAWAERNGVDVDELMKVMHGVKAIETIRRFAPPGVDPQREFELLLQAEIDDVADVVEIAGAAAFTAALPPERWAIVTSAPRSLAEVRLKAAGVTPPAVMVTADDVERGKPAPDCFLLAAERLGVDPRDCLVWEDAPAGIAAAEAAGADVMVISATHHEPLDTRWRAIGSYGELTAAWEDGALTLGDPDQRPGVE
ncbi:HAD-IA family hydrolase [Sphingomonas sp. BK235]|uniref:HAD-IA family hydrolase n=1 Tax=Sphingomonas sp. BK235 TaxID=2512131 RepID=UPI0010D3D17D|nr:HAD-IA family hydrolase [Sphingomonas sp. BK235]TCP37483.1 sugar-phosphatase [Sphingomonas sp. BK235]